jgi:hypothetical protein
MVSDMLVALQQATANGTSLFALNHHALAPARHQIYKQLASAHEPGSVACTNGLTVPQVRHTCGVLGLQPAGLWGLISGINEHKVAGGVTPWQSKLGSQSASAAGPCLLRLALERSHSAHHAVEIITDLLERLPTAATGDNIFLFADAKEAFVLESAGRFWGLLECGHARVVTNVPMIRQDWRRLAPGLATHVIEQGWWHDDGSKIDFVGCLGQTNEQARNAQKRWGRASLALTQQQGAIDAHFLRRMLSDYFLANRELLPRSHGLACSFLADISDSAPLLAWIGFGPPQVSVYFPICFAGDLPPAFNVRPGVTSIEDRTHDLLTMTAAKDRDRLTDALERMQTRFDLDADDFLFRAQEAAHHGRAFVIPQLATEMMRQHADLFDKEYRRLFGVEVPVEPVPVAEEMLFYA